MSKKWKNSSIRFLIRIISQQVPGFTRKKSAKSLEVEKVVKITTFISRQAQIPINKLFFDFVVRLGGPNDRKHHIMLGG